MPFPITTIVGLPYAMASGILRDLFVRSTPVAIIHPILIDRIDSRALERLPEPPPLDGGAQ